MAEANEVFISLGMQLQRSLQHHPAAVARDIATLIQGQDEPAAASFRLQRYQRKVDVARRVFSAYDAGIDRATDATPLPPDGYLGLAWLFWRQAREASGTARRADRLRWLNSGFNCLDHVGAAGALLTQGLDGLLHEALATA